MNKINKLDRQTEVTDIEVTNSIDGTEFYYIITI